MSYDEVVFTKGDTLCHCEKRHLTGIVVESEKCKTFEVKLYYPESKTTLEVVVLPYIRCKMVLIEKVVI